ncbi:PRC-barrel domain-containing protein [Plantactinospora siamensis]|uniref:PRC-barrel domain-containing protein n=1 Tax=Plantactinospora siamensis TaxID=555372 RepID=A0ABV6NT63_9ACTN
MDTPEPRTPPPLAEPGLHGGPAPFRAWSYRDDVRPTDSDLVGYRVEAADGHIGKVDRANHDVDDNFLVVDTGPWIFGKKVLLPAGVIERVDHEERTVHVDRSKDEIKGAPEYDENTHADPAYRDELGGYYGDRHTAPGTRDASPDSPTGRL